VRYAVVTVCAALVALAAGVGRAGATIECRGLPVCVRVAGPWVVVPASRAPAQFQLTCPRGFLVGGLDAELSDRAIDLDFGGLLGSPVNPGVTTQRSVVFRGVYTGSARRTTTFRPHIGCIPAGGGGSGPVPYRRLQAAFPPGRPTIRRVRTVRLRQGIVRAVAACGRGERLISGWHSVGVYNATTPSADVLASVSAKHTLAGGRVIATARLIAPVRAVVQVGAVCGGGQ
jgi:hypothetical protein